MESFELHIKTLGEDPNTEDFQIIHDLINEILAGDASSMAFRYPVGCTKLEPNNYRFGDFSNFSCNNFV